MANTTLSNILALLPENGSGDISATDIQTAVTRLWETSVITGAVDNNVAIFTTDIHGNTGAIIDSGYSITDLPLGTSVAATINGKISYPGSGSSGDLLQYNGTTADWVTPDKTLVGLSNVDDTSDLNKPISTATQTALDGKQDELYLSYSEALSVKTYLFGVNTDLGIELETAAAVPFAFKNNIAFSNNAELELPNFVDETAAGSAAAKESKIYYDTTDSTVKFSDGSLWINIISAATNQYDNSLSGLSATTTQGAIDELADIPTLDVGAWIPTITTGTNLTAASPISANFMRMGDMVSISGSIQLDVTSSGWVDFTINLPIPSNFAAASDASGVINGGTGLTTEWGNGTFDAEDTLDELAFRAYANFSGVSVWAFSGSFQII